MAAAKVFSTTELLEHWQGHRHLTRRVIEAFPDTDLFGFTPVESLRSFGEQVKELIEWPEPTLQGILTDHWHYKAKYEQLNTKTDLLAAWDVCDATIAHFWSDIGGERLETIVTDPWFGSKPRSNLDRVLYLIDNEVHHRGQGYVYLRLLGLEPPPFFER